MPIQCRYELFSRFFIKQQSEMESEQIQEKEKWTEKKWKRKPFLMCNKLTLVTISLWPQLRECFRHTRIHIFIAFSGWTQFRIDEDWENEKEEEEKTSALEWQSVVKVDPVSVINGIYFYYSLIVYELFRSAYSNLIGTKWFLCRMQTENAKQ